MSEDIDIDLSDATPPDTSEALNPNPDEVEDDGLGGTEPEPFDPKDVDEDDDQ